MSTVGNLDKPRGNRTFLPEGTQNYRLTGVRQEVHSHFGTRQLVLDVSLNGDVYNAEIALEAGGRGDPSIVADIIYSTMKSLGLSPAVLTRMKAAGQDVSNVETDLSWGNELAAALPGFVGAVLELYVKHKPGKKLRDDGTPFVNANTYVNRVVQAAPSGQAAPVGASVPAGYANTDDIPFN
jgi:hypothetical protein